VHPRVLGGFDLESGRLQSLVFAFKISERYLEWPAGVGEVGIWAYAAAVMARNKHTAENISLQRLIAPKYSHVPRAGQFCAFLLFSCGRRAAVDCAGETAASAVLAAERTVVDEIPHFSASGSAMPSRGLIRVPQPSESPRWTETNNRELVFYCPERSVLCRLKNSA